MYEEPGFADEVVVVLVDGEVVDGFLAWQRSDRNHPAPVPLKGLELISHPHTTRFDPGGLRLAAFDPEGMTSAGPERIMFALDAYLQQRVLVQRSERRDRLRDSPTPFQQPRNRSPSSLLGALRRTAASKRPRAARDETDLGDHSNTRRLGKYPIHPNCS